MVLDLLDAGKDFEDLEQGEESLLVFVNDFVLGVGEDIPNAVQSEPDDVEGVGLEAAEGVEVLYELDLGLLETAQEFNSGTNLYLADTLNVF